MEYWSVEKKGHQSFNHYSNTPILQYFNAPKFIEIESSYHRLPSFGYRTEKFSVFY
jgi:hypothetical protein